MKIPHTMRRALLSLLFSTGVLYAGHSYAQGVQISIDAQNQSMAEVLELIEQQSDFSFIYDSRSVDTHRKMTVHAEKESIFDLLNYMFAGSDIAYTVINKKIILKKGEEMLGTATQGSTITVTGTVTDAAGTPMPGVTVVVKRSGKGVITDADGRYAIPAPNGDAVLVFSFIGYATQEVTIGDQRVIPIALADDTRQIEEVMVIGYGTVRKSDLTGSISSVSEKQFRNEPVRKVQDVLQGRSAGVEVTNTTGEVGATAKIRIRGTGSVNRRNDPIYVLDGQIDVAVDVINPNDIQSMEILKDASATAIYGSRGANGVILITTKRGAEGKSRVVFDTSLGISKIGKKYDLMNPYEYATALNDLKGAGTIGANDLEDYRTGKQGIDWYDLMTRTGSQQRHNLTVSGGNAKTKYYVGAEMTDEKGISITSRHKRYQFRTNLDTEVTPWFNIVTSINLSQLYYRNTDINWTNTVNYSPTMNLPMTAVNSSGQEYYIKDPYNSIGVNPYGERISNDRDHYKYRMYGLTDLQFKILDGLTLSVQGGAQYSHELIHLYGSAKVDDGRQSTMEHYSYYCLTLQNTNNLTYFKRWDDHQLTATAVWEIYHDDWGGVGVNGSNLNNPEIVGYWNYGNARNRDGWNGVNIRSMVSGLFRGMYSYKNKYLLTTAIRADGSSKFQGKNKWGYFPSAAIAWDAAKEDFLQQQNTLQQLKLRLSYGVTGNSDIDPYSTLGMLDAMSYNWGTANSYTGYWGNKVATPKVKWEKNVSYNAGIDFSLWNGVLGGSLDIYRKDSKDLLFQKQIPRYDGGGTFWVNQGKMRNTGFDLSINATPVRGKDFTWETIVNTSYVENKILDLAGEPFIYYETRSNIGGTYQIHMPGKPIGTFYLYDWTGFDDQGRNLYRTASGGTSAAPTSEDSFVMGQGNPNWLLGWNNTVNWKNWTASVFFNGAFGHDKLNVSRWTTAAYHGEWRFITLRDAYFKNWDNVSDKSKAKYATLKDGSNFDTGKSSFWLENANFVKLKNISIAYTIPQSVLKVMSAQISLSVQNLWTITNYQGMDPETFSNGIGIDWGAYPIPRTFTLGVRLEF